ncbi:hypothetical protein B7P43_G12605 [Cryptotermes secundus]|nr:hypothetical protein B7P43_G12605 [Cryptotermes secundus]
MYKQLEETPLVMVEQADQLPGLLQDLSSYSEIAVDLEHHSYRSFQGFTCLMQISTRDTDYIIDTLLLRDKLCCLNEIFTKPSIIKVFHGAIHDVEWLQRDLSVYVVNMFDTHEGAKLLNFAQLSLAFLMKHYCNVVADKHYQLADWRIRPLPDELVMYARKDTHYLLYIYDMMQNALLDAANGQKNLLQSVFQQSTEICKTRYEKPVFREDSHMTLYRRNKRLFDNRQLYALRELYRWRDRISREDDESTGYVLPNHMMLQIAESLPREMQGILACCNPIPPIVRQNLHKLHTIVLEARDQPLVKPLLEEELWTRVSTQNWNKVNLDGALHCPHDLTHIQDFRDDLPTLLGSTYNINETEVGAKKIQMIKPMISVFEAEAEIDTPNHVTFVCPYERYKKVKPFIQSQETTLTSAENTATVPGTEDDNAERIQRIKDHFVEVSSKMVKEGAEEEAEKTNSAITTHSLPPLPPSPEPKRSEEMETLRSKVSRKRKNRKKDSSAQPSKRLKLDKSVEVNSPSTSVPRTGSKKMKEEGFQPFDYSKVNFSRFRGGSRTSAQIENKGKPKGKKRKRHHGKNKSMTFERNQW